MTDPVEALIERLDERSESYVKTLAPVHYDELDAFADRTAARTLSRQRDELAAKDTDWILAIGHALGLDSGYEVPIVPEVEPFKRLFAAIRERDLAAKDAQIAALTEDTKQRRDKIRRIEERVRAGLAFCKDHKVGCQTLHAYMFGGEFRCDCGLDDKLHAAIAAKEGA